MVRYQKRLMLISSSSTESSHCSLLSVASHIFIASAQYRSVINHFCGTRDGAASYGSAHFRKLGKLLHRNNRTLRCISMDARIRVSFFESFGVRFHFRLTSMHLGINPSVRSFFAPPSRSAFKSKPTFTPWGDGLDLTFGGRVRHNLNVWLSLMKRYLNFLSTRLGKWERKRRRITTESRHNRSWKGGGKSHPLHISLKFLRFDIFNLSMILKK